MFIFLNHTFASYSLLPTTDDIEATRTDKALVHLAYSDAAYANVGRLSIGNFIKNIDDSVTYVEHGSGSAVYIGSKTCITAAHCRSPNPLEYCVIFEISGKNTKPYKAQHFITHPRWRSDAPVDLAVLILEEDIEGLEGLKISHEFLRTQIFKDYQHLLTYVGYGVKIYDNFYFCNHWFHAIDKKRRALRTHTRACVVEHNCFGLHSAYYGKYNDGKTNRPFIAYESYVHSGMSGGAVLNDGNEVVAIIGHVGLEKIPFSTEYLYFTSIMNRLIVMTGFPIPLFNMFPGFNRGSYTYSVPLAPFKEWIDEVRKQYDNTYVADYV